MSANPDSNLTRLVAAMAPFENADLVTLFRNESSVDEIRRALEDVAAPDVVVLMIGADRGLTGTFHGVEGFIDAWQDFTDTFQHLWSDIGDLIEVSDDVILAETHQKGTTATAGVEIDNDAAAVFRFTNGRLQQAEFHLDREAARRAAGIENGDA
jgi:ketosteroid isomerase-like protein